MAIVLLIFGWYARDVFVYLATALLSALLSAGYSDTQLGVSVVLWCLGAYYVWLALIQMATAGGSARGISQFKGIIDTIRGKFQ